MITTNRDAPQVPPIETTLVKLVLWVRVLGFIWMTLLVIITWFTDDGANLRHRSVLPQSLGHEDMAIRNY